MEQIVRGRGTLHWNRFGVWVRWVLLPVFLFSALLQSQQAVAPDMHMTTQERLETETWWPTMGTAALKSYTGSASCVGCHADHTATSATGMQRAAIRGSEAHFLPRTGAASFVSGTVTYSVQDDKDGVQLSAASGGREATQAADWVMGAGGLGRTFLYNEDGRWYQSEASYYTLPEALDITTGFGPKTSRSPKEALGNLLSPAEARACFGCHTVHATTSEGLKPMHAEAGIGCEACHGPGQQHVSKMGEPQDSGKLHNLAIFDPAKLSPSESIDFCGACHRSFADASLSTGLQVDRAVVRFQPYRLEESRCWRATRDERLTCVACHDPHQPLNRDVASYDKNCLECHSGVKQGTAEQHIAAVCPKATHDCTTCHMPKVNLASVHGDFTDHYIRIAKSGEPMPR